MAAGQSLRLFVTHELEVEYTLGISLNFFYRVFLDIIRGYTYRTSYICSAGAGGHTTRLGAIHDV